MRQQVLTGLVCLLVAGCDLTGSTPTNNNNPNDPACQIQAPAQQAPGWPYDLVMFRSTVLPVLVNTCGASGCHLAATANGNFKVWADAAPGNCSYAKTFNAFRDKTDVNNPPNSAVYIAVSGGDPLHPYKDMGTAQMLLGFVQNANMTQSSSGGSGGTPPPNANPFDYNVFQQQIQPILDTAEGKGCTGASCHGGPMGIGGLQLNAMPAPNSQQMQDNFNKVVSICSITNPQQSLFYLQATNRHASGGSAVVDANQGTAILTWIQTAKNNASSGGGSTTNCPPADNFNLGVFNTEILPILTGAIDLNNPAGGRTTTGCARATCHGADRTGGALVIKTTSDAATNLANFACFVNLNNPTVSDILLCPLNQPGCRHYPHPGQDVFSGPTDLNYQRILSYLFAAKTVATPIDFAFYARQIDTIFNDVNSVEGGSQNRTCADVTSCHGVTIAGQRPPNGSNFAILANASSKDRLGTNFASALNFINFLSPRGSSLFLYPTDQVSNLANPFATGLHHPGGLDFTIDSTQATAILTWAAGLRPDVQGFQPNWLVAGDYSAAAITDPTAIDEINVKPSLFDPDGASQFNNGQWDALFGVNTVVDLNQSFPRAQTAGRIAYAAAYVLNSSPSDIQAQITITSPNAIKLYAGNQPVLQSDNASQGATGLALLPAYGTGKTTTRMLLKVFQRAGDNGFNFTVRFTDQFGNALTNVTGELIMKLSPDGGI